MALNQARAHSDTARAHSDTAQAQQTQPGPTQTQPDAERLPDLTEFEHAPLPTWEEALEEQRGAAPQMAKEFRYIDESMKVLNAQRAPSSPADD